MPTRQEIAKLLQQNPEESDEEILALLKQQSAPTEPGIIKRAWDAATRPIVGKERYLGVGLPRVENPGIAGKVYNTAADFGEAMTSPLDLATGVAGMGAKAAARAGLMGLSKAAKAAELAGIGSYGVAGAAQLPQSQSLGEGLANVAQMGMSALGVRGAAKSRMGRAIDQRVNAALPGGGGARGVGQGQVTPELESMLEQQMAAHQAGGGSTFNPRQGNMAGQDFYSVGGVVPSTVLPQQEFNKEALRAFILKNQDALKDPSRSVGTWANEGKVHLDITDLLPKEQAIQKAGERGELAIFGLKNFDEVPTKHTDPTTGQTWFGKAERELPSAPTREQQQATVGIRDAAFKKASQGAGMGTTPKEGYSAAGTTAMSVAMPGVTRGIEEQFRDTEGNTPEWTKYLVAAGDIGAAAGVGAVGMASLRKTAVPPPIAAKREVIANLFLKKGDQLEATAASQLLQTLPAKQQDAVINRATQQFLKLKHGADPQLFNVDVQRRLIEEGLPHAGWYRSSNEGLKKMIHPKELSLVADLLALTSTQATPYDNTNLMLTALFRMRMGMPTEQVVEGLGLAEGSVAKYLTTGEIPGRKHANFAQNLQGNFQAVTGDSQAGRGAGMLIWDPKARIKQKSGAGTKARGGFIGPEQVAASHRKALQGRGVLNVAEYDLFEDYMTRLAPEFGLAPADAQAAHWFSSLKNVVTPRMEERGGGRNVPAYQRDPYDQQLERRFQRAGVRPGEELTPDALARIVAEIKASKGKGFKFTREKTLF